MAPLGDPKPIETEAETAAAEAEARSEVFTPIETACYTALTQNDVPEMLVFYDVLHIYTCTFAIRCIDVGA